MSHTEPIPHVWEMHDASVLAHRFALPPVLPPYTALTVSPGQTGLVFLGNQRYVLPNAGLHLVTASLIHSISEGANLNLADYADAVLPYNSQITLLDTRHKVWRPEVLDLTFGDGSKEAWHLSLTFHVENAEKFDSCGATYQPCEGGSEIRQDDPVIAEAFRKIVADVTVKLSARAASLPSAREAATALCSGVIRKELRIIADGYLTPLGLAALPPHLTPARATCPYCQKALSITEIRNHFCSAVDDDGKPQKGCDRQLYTCPSCQTIVGPERQTCPTCDTELLYCATPGCNTYRKVERGRFCPVCKRACYPLPDREFFPLN